MPLSQIDDMNIIANTGAIRCCVVVTEHDKLISFTNRYLAYKRQQVVGRIRGIFTNFTTFVCTTRVEIAQYHNIEFRSGLNQILQNFLYHYFCSTVRVSSINNLAAFTDRYFIWLTIDGSRGTEHKPGHSFS